MTLPEILISAALLLVLTAVALASLMPVLRRQERFNTADERVRGLMIARENLHERLARARLTHVGPDRLDYLLPVVLQTNQGPLSQLAPGELVQYDPTPHSVLLDGGVLKCQGQVLWRLGPDARLKVEDLGDEALLVRFTFSMEGWERSFTLFLPNRDQ